MSDFFQDTFVGSNDTLLSAHTPDIGTGWSNANGGDPKLDGSGRIKSGTANGICNAVVTPPTADYSVAATITWLNIATDQNWHILARSNSAGTTRYCVVWIAESSQMILQKYISGTPTSFDLNTTFVPVVGTQYTIKLSVKGTTVSYSINGTVIASATDSSISATGTPGIVVQGVSSVSTGIRMANVEVAQLIDNNANLTAASVNAGGTAVALTFDAAVSSSTVADFTVICAGRPVAISSITGSGTSWTLNLATVLIAVAQTVIVNYVGLLATWGHVTATNSSTILPRAAIAPGRQFGAFIHFSSATFGITNPPSVASINAAFTPTSYNMSQWLDVVQSAGARYAVLTTKHDGGFCLWPTESGAFNIAQTDWYTANKIDIVKDFTTQCRARGLAVGLYLNFYDPWYLSVRTGHDNTYTPSATFVAYMEQQISELLSNYGQIDILWLDSWSYGATYTNAPYAPIKAFITSLQPNCVVINNEHTGDLSHSDVACYEGDGPQVEPVGNLYPAEFCETIRSDSVWAWTASGQDTYKNVYSIAATVNRLTAERCSLLLNFPPNNLGVMPASTVTYAATLGGILGTTGGAILPIPANIKSGVDRGDGAIGTLYTTRAAAR